MVATTTEEGTLAGELRIGKPTRLACPAFLRGLIMDAVEFWEKFCGLPPSMKEIFSPGDVDGDMGYKKTKERSGGTIHHGEDFSISCSFLEELRKKAGEIPEAAQLIDQSNRLFQEVEDKILEQAKTMEMDCNIPGLADEVLESRKSWMLSYTHYLWGRSERAVIESPRVSRTGFSIVLGESNHGIEVLDLQKEWQSMPVMRGQMVMLPGMQLQLRSGNKLAALCTRVSATTRTAQDGRYALICSVPLLGTKTMRPTDEAREPGFNYDLSIAKLEKLFE